MMLDRKLAKFKNLNELALYRQLNNNVLISRTVIELKAKREDKLYLRETRGTLIISEFTISFVRRL